MDNCYCIKLRKISHKITNIYNDYLKPSNLSISQYSLMAHLDTLKHPSVSELADVLELDRTTLVRTLKPLERRELVSDNKIFGQRNRQLFLTKKGKQLLNEAHHYWDEAQRAVEKALKEEEIIQLNTLDKKLENVRKRNG